MADVNYDYYKIFYCVAKYGSFTKAANILDSDQPNITRTVNRLESELGCKLFTRSRRGVVLTPEGEALYAHVEPACLQIAQGENELAGIRGMQNGTVSIGASETALHLLLLEKLREYHALYPNIRLRISNHSTPQALAALERGLVDFAVVTTPVPVEKPLRQTELVSFTEILIGGTAFRPLAQRTLQLSELQQYPVICLGEETMTYRFYNEFFMEHNLVLRPDTEAATADQILPLVQCNLGLGFLPEELARDALAKSSIVHIPLAEEIPPRHISLVRDSRKTLSIAADRFVQMLPGCRQASICR
jgi:DNA-binding transcriptional LysR family regulator